MGFDVAQKHSDFHKTFEADKVTGPSHMAIPVVSLTQMMASDWKRTPG